MHDALRRRGSPPGTHPPWRGGNTLRLLPLDTFFSLPESTDEYGTYGREIHEMLEARAMRRGQFGFSNQPARVRPRGTDTPDVPR